MRLYEQSWKGFKSSGDPIVSMNSVSEVALLIYKYIIIC